MPLDCCRQRLNRARPSINGYRGGFGYNLADGLIIVVGATKSEIATTDASVFDILRDVVKYVTPRHQLILSSLRRNGGQLCSAGGPATDQ